MKTNSCASNGRSWWPLLVSALVVAALMAVASPASAQLTDEEKEYLKEKTDGPSSIYLIAPRIRAVTVPSFILDAFLDRHGSNWEDGANLGYGMEFVLRKPTYDLVFGFEWADISMSDDWWLESGDPARKADFTTFPLQIVSLTVGINWFFDISEVFGLYLGGGLGVGLVLGDVEKTDPSIDCINALETSGDPKDSSRLDQEPCTINGQPQTQPGTTEIEEDIPPALPIINLAFGTQFTIAEHIAWRIEAGANLPYFYAGTSIGYMWW